MGDGMHDVALQADAVAALAETKKAAMAAEVAGVMTTAGKAAVETIAVDCICGGEVGGGGLLWRQRSDGIMGR